MDPNYPSQYPQQDQGFLSGNAVNPSDSFLILMIDIEKDLEKFEMETLRRKRLKVDLKTKKKEWVPLAQGVKQVCNELGICEILGLIRSRTTITGKTTKKTKEQIANDMFHFHMTLNELFALRADDWDLDEELIKPLIESCIGLVQDVIYSSLEGFTAINVKSSYSRHENSNINDGPTGPTVMGLRVG